MKTGPVPGAPSPGNAHQAWKRESWPLSDPASTCEDNRNCRPEALQPSLRGSRGGGMLLGRPLSLPEDSGNALQVLSEPLPAKIQGSLQVLPKPVCLPLCQSMPAHREGTGGGGDLPGGQRNLPALSQAPTAWEPYSSSVGAPLMRKLPPFLLPPTLFQ